MTCQYPTDRGYLEVLPWRLQLVAHGFLNQAEHDGSDLADMIARADLPDADKQALTEVWR